MACYSDPVRPDVEPLRHQLADTWARFPGVELALVFGSVARGQATSNSDLDIALVGSDVDVLDLSREIGAVAGREAQVVLLDNPSIVLLNEIVGESLPLFERENGVYARWVSRTLIQLEDDLPWYRRQRDAWLRRVSEKGL